MRVYSRAGILPKLVSTRGDACLLNFPEAFTLSADPNAGATKLNCFVKLGSSAGTSEPEKTTLVIQNRAPSRKRSNFAQSGREAPASKAQSSYRLTNNQVGKRDPDTDTKKEKLLRRGRTTESGKEAPMSTKGKSCSS